MFEFNLYSLNNFKCLENLFLENNNGREIVLVCIGTKKYFNDSFGVIIGDYLKNHSFFVYGSSKREINGLNYLNVYNFIKNKHKNAKIIIIDSVYVKSDKKPILIYKNSPIIVSGINNNVAIGDECILFNSFSYSNLDYFQNSIILLKQMFEKFTENFQNKS